MDGQPATTPEAPAGQPVEQQYITNPFTVALQGINALKDKANSVFILALVIGIVSFLSNFVGNPFPGTGDEPVAQLPSGFSPNWEVVGVIAAIVGLVVVTSLLVGLVLWGIFSFTAYKLSKGERTDIGEAFNAVMANFWRLLLVGIILIVRLIGWYLLLIIPGIIMQTRYGLSGLIAFAEPELKPSQVVSRSAQLTKGAWFDTYGSMNSFGIITFGVMQAMTEVGASSVLYRQLKWLKESGAPKPPTHILSYLLLIIPIVLFLVFIFFLMFIIFALIALSGRP